MLRRTVLCRGATPDSYLRSLLSPNSPGTIPSLELFNLFTEHFSSDAWRTAAQPATQQGYRGVDLLRVVTKAAKVPADKINPDFCHVALSGESIFRATAGENGQLRLVPGKAGFSITGESGSSSTVAVVAQLPGDGCRLAFVSVPSSLVVAEKSMQQGSVLVRAGLKEPFSFTEAAHAVPLAEYKSSEDFSFAVRGGLATAKICMIDCLKRTAALHASHFARYGSHLCNDQLHQRRLSLLDSASYGLRALSFISDGCSADVTAVDYLASTLLRTSCSEASLVLGTTGSKLRTAVKHATNPALAIDYLSAADIVNGAAPSLLAETDFGVDSLATAAIGEELTELRNSPKRSRFVTKNSSSPFPAMFSKSSGSAGTRLNNVHMNLTPAAAQIEAGIEELLSVAAGKKFKEPVTTLDTIVTLQLAGEVLSSAAALYRASAALMTLEDETAAQQEATMANVFCDLSRMRRGELLRRYHTMQQRQLKATSYVEYEELATNCIELGTANAPAATAAQGAKK